VSGSWNPKAAAAYLDDRESWWAQWPVSARDHGTYCISCHTALLYALARPQLRYAVGDPSLSASELSLIDNVTKRVRLWKETKPYYSDQGYEAKTAESRGTESVLNALILANDDAERGQLSDDSRTAFNNMWTLQQDAGNQKGTWRWLQFDQEPWEAKDSVYYGAALAAIAVGTAPGNYSANPEIQPNLRLLRDYLRRESASQSTLNRVYLLWASTRISELLSFQEQTAIVKEALSKQQADGGWRLATIAWTWNQWTARSFLKMWLREEGTPLKGKSDGVATGLIVYVLQQAAINQEDTALQRGLSWLRTNQSPQGSWPASSINTKRHLSANTGLFMNDAGTALAVMALSNSQRVPTPKTSPSAR
jgi:squalene-hopene/tetraprenyl-beta-curcumene cyclase